ncbi:hypothetical protein EIK77_008216 [Talaromyces pinophilus]|nr:hypothetical protein EIK77_008216 [Talaromyces pinophilus]
MYIYTDKSGIYRKFTGGEPFAMTLAGRTFYVLTNTRDISECNKNLITLSFDVFVKELMLNCGCSPSSVDKMCQEPPRYIDGSTTTALNPSRKSISRLAMDFHQTQLLPGRPNSKLEELTRSMLSYVDAMVTWEIISVNSHYLKQNAKGTENEIQVSLMRFCGKILIEAATASYFGKAFSDIDPTIVDIFYTFDSEVWKLIYSYPRQLSKDVHLARDRLVAAFTTHFQRPQSERQGEAWFTKALEEEQRRIGLTEEEMAAIVLTVYLG